MSEIQHAGARKLLDVISNFRVGQREPTYADAARLIGRPEKDARAVAQMCDLLDAAAFLSGTPLLALVKIREKSGDVNAKAFKEDEELRKALIKKSSGYDFAQSDFLAIANGLAALKGKGNRRAWAYVWEVFPGDEARSRLLGITRTGESPADAIADLGTDSADRAMTQSWSYVRDQNVRAAVLKRADGICEYCGKMGFLKGNGARYLESHHVIALADDGEDRVTNVLALCPNDHREAHFGKRSREIEAEMMVKLSIITRHRP